LPENLGNYFFADQDGKKIKEVSNAFSAIVDKLELNKNVKDRDNVLSSTHAGTLSQAGWPFKALHFTQ